MVGSGIHVLGVRCSERAGFSRVKGCRRISAVCVRKDNHWSVVKNSLGSTILACLPSVVTMQLVFPQAKEGLVIFKC